MTGILYFSSTGNSLFIAEKIKEKNDGNIIYIPKYTGDASEFDKLIIVCPVYSFGLPAHVYKLITRINFTIPLYMVLNYGGFLGGADYLTYLHCDKCGVNIKAVYTMQMPENFTVKFNVPEGYKKKLLASAPEKALEIAEKIASNKKNIPEKKHTFAAAYHKSRHNWYKMAEDFSIADNCTKCGKCVKLCPTKNITLENGSVTFSDKCVACLGCYHRCPEKAVLYKKKRPRKQYINPDIDIKKLGKNS